MKLLCAADLHLGRRPTRLPDEIVEDPSLAAAVTPQAAWRALVDLALAERVAAVLLGGDLLDDEHDFYGTFDDLRTGVERLIEGGIGVLAVSGNHDVEVMSRLVRHVPGLRLLGEGGVWEAATLTDGATQVHVVGWSYPSSAVTYSPVAQVRGALADLPAGMVIGLLHCDRDQVGSRYAPVSGAELAAAPVDVWLLGHVHKPDFGPLHGPSPHQRLGGYLGSISPGDPGEEGPRGAWLLDLTGGAVSASLVPLAGLRYETLLVDVGGLAAADELASTVVTAVTEHATRLHDSAPYAADSGGVPAPYAADSGGVPAPLAADPGGPPALRAVGLRVRLVGRSAIRPELAARLRGEDPRDVVVRAGGLLAFVHDVRLEVLPAIDIAAVANGRDPLALVARKLLLLDDPRDPGRAELLAAARQRLQATVASAYYAALPEADLSDAALEDHLRQAALTLIDAMERS